MQTTDPRRTPRPDSDAHTPKPAAADRPRPARRRAPQRRGPSQSTLVFAAVLVVIVLVAVLVLVLVSRHDRAPKNDPAAQATPTAQVTEQDTVLAEAKHLAAQYDYDKAIAAVTGFAGWENVPELQQAKADFEAQKAQAVRYADPTTIPHIFFHTLIADTARAFDGDAVERIIGRDEQRAVHERESDRQQRCRRICERAADARLTAQKACYAEITAQHARNKEQKQRDIVLQIDRNGSAAREKRAERCEDAVFEHWSHPLRCLMLSERKAAALPDTECRPDTWRRPRPEWPCVRRPCRPTP